nr:nucleotidyltransferase family protein [Devosia geojensis]
MSSVETARAEDHLRYSGAGETAQRAVLDGIIRAEPTLMRVLETLRDIDLPDHLLVAGALYNAVWNHLTGRPALAGVKDIDVAYFDASNLSWEVEDMIIKRLDGLFGDLPVPVEARNPARVHLWFPQKFGTPFPPLSSAGETLTRYASKTHAVGARLGADGRLTILAPFGLDDLFSFRMVPNHALDNRKTHETKSARATSIWPQVTVVPW